MGDSRRLSGAVGTPRTDRKGPVPSVLPERRPTPRDREGVGESPQSPVSSHPVSSGVPSGVWSEIGVSRGLFLYHSYRHDGDRARAPVDTRIRTLGDAVGDEFAQVRLQLETL